MNQIEGLFVISIILGFSVFVAIACVMAYGLVLNQWPFITGFDKPTSLFYDLQVLLYQADSVGLSSNMSNYEANPELGIVPNYPLLLPRFLNLLTLGQESLVPIGIFLAVIYGITMASLWGWVSRGHSFRDYWITGLLALLVSVSPPAVLALERGNYDLLIFALVVATIVLLARFPKISSLVLSVATLAKLFPIGLVLIFLQGKKLFWLAFVPIAFLLSYFFFSPSEFLSVSLNTPRPNSDGFGQFVPHGLVGSVTYLSFAQKVFIWAGFHLLSFLIYALLAKSFIQRVQEWDIVKSLLASRTATSMVVGGTGVSGVVYLIGNSYDYRLIFFCIPMLGLARIFPPNSPIMSLAYPLVLAILYFSFASGPLAPLGDLALAIFLIGLVHITLLVLRTKWVG